MLYSQDESVVLRIIKREALYTRQRLSLVGRTPNWPVYAREATKGLTP